MKRRSFITAGSAWLLWNSTAGNALAQASLLPGAVRGAGPQQASPLPYRIVGPIPEDRRTALVFFSFTCPFSLQYHETLWDWAESLPRSWQVRFVPVLVQGIESLHSLRAYTAASLTDASKLRGFMSVAFNELLQRQADAKSETTWLRIVDGAGYSRSDFGEAWKSLGDTTAMIDPIVERQARYDLEVTPSVVIGGNYLVTPDSTNANEALFVQLLNGMVSKSEGYA